MKKASLFLILITLFLIMPVIVFSQEQEPVDEETLILDQEDPEQAEEPDESLNAFTAWDFIRMLLILGAVIAVIYLIFYLLRRSGRNRFQDNEMFTIISSQAINGNRSMHLVVVGNQYFLVGAGENTVSLISEITDKETIDSLKLKVSNMHAEQKKSFRDIMLGIFRPAGGQGPQASFFESVDFMKNQRERLKRF